MSNRKNLSKKIRFEVFKRDKFICQYCGKSAPNVVLEVDHIDPVSKGGLDDILNLITSCYDCNRGKSNRELSDDSVVTKQRNQLELLQQRREQIELIFEWRKGLHQIDQDTTEMVISYINQKIEKFKLNESGVKTISALTRKYDLADILESIDMSAENYLRYDSGGVLIQESAEEFIKKITGILVNKGKPAIERKASYIKGICRNRFSYWNAQTGSILLNNYIKALKEHGWDENRILNDLENELQPRTIECKNWSEWRNLVEKWTEDVKNWGSGANEIGEHEINEEELLKCAEELVREKENIVLALEYIGKVFENFKKENLRKCIDATVLNYLVALEEYYSADKESRQQKPTFHQAGYHSGLLSMFAPVNNMLTFYLDNAASSIVAQYLDSIEAYNVDDAKPEYFQFIAKKYHALVTA